ncbi:MAG: T9SS type A sorting domain-containing protein [Arcicella sp.]|nr:T9SS type A sorting domain-containing protein [Arcicella sp.]
MKNFMLPTKITILVIGLMMSNITYSQITIDSPSVLKNACETSPGNVVNVSQSIKISSPTFQFTPTQINSPCTLVITNQSKVEFERANVAFTGALSVQSTGKGEMVAVNSLIKATSISISLGGEDSQISSSQSAFQAQAGNLTMTLGNKAKMEIYSVLNTSTPNSLSATGMINISAGQNFTASIADMGVAGNQGIRIASNGIEALLKLEKVVFRSSAGSANVVATGTKCLLEAKESGFYVANQTNIRYSGGETNIKLSEIGFGGTTFNTPMIGAVTINAAEGSASIGNIEMSDIRTYGTINGGFKATAAVGGNNGGVKVEKSNITVGGDVLFETGNVGTTEVKENSITSGTKITVKTGNGGNCLATPNRSLTAPSVITCSSPMARLANVYDIDEMPDLSVYPNPSNDGSINIKLKQTSESGNVILTDLNGNTVKQWDGVKGDNISVKDLKRGTYIIQYMDTTVGTKKSTKFIVD